MTADEQDEVNPLDVLVDLFVYAPVGLLYEYEDVLPKLIKRGKSQVQLARVLGQLAVRGRRSDVDVGDVATAASTLVARAITDIGTLVGLAPEQPPAEPPPPATRPTPDRQTSDEVIEVDSTEGVAGQLPIANYDDLKAREIISLLDSLSPAQRASIRAHEEAGRSRKTVLAKLDRLDG
ncbi:MAG: hypothetical protein OEV40_13955 [Acidimicrobiia bacterium]|nr:hypothetical protein [Acidimicrobiia bacterium]